MIALTDWPGDFAGGQAFGVSTDGSVIVGVGKSAGANQAFRFTAATGMVGLGWLPSTMHDSFAFDVSLDGNVACGISNSGSSFHVEPVRWSEPGEILGLGDVPGGIFYAIAWGISGDGSTIVGAARTTFDSRDEMFIWREDIGFILPDTLHGADFGTAAQAATADGSVVVGSGPDGALIWDAVHGMRGLQQLLESEHGLNLSSWTLGIATDISADGRAIAGYGFNPAGNVEAWLVRFDAATDVRTGEPPAESRAACSPRLEYADSHPAAAPTHVRLHLATSEHVTIEIFDTRGRLVDRFDRGVLGPGPHVVEWSGRSSDGSPARSGAYYLRVSTAGWRGTLKVVRP